MTKTLRANKHRNGNDTHPAAGHPGSASIADVRSGERVGYAIV